jgi:hypothetical protein
MAFGVTRFSQQGGAWGERHAGVEAAAGQVGVGDSLREAGVAVVKAAEGDLALLPGVGQQGAGGHRAVAAAAQGGGKAGGLALEEGGGLSGDTAPGPSKRGSGGITNWGAWGHWPMGWRRLAWSSSDRRAPSKRGTSA